jgi:hypothetical protein
LQLAISLFFSQIAENVKEFFHNEGIHSTTIQPEFVESMDAASMSASEDCAIACPRDPTQEEPSCQANKCCPPQKSSQNTPVTERRANGFEVNGESGEQLEVRKHDLTLKGMRSMVPHPIRHDVIIVPIYVRQSCFCWERNISSMLTIQTERVIVIRMKRNGPARNPSPIIANSS